MALPQIGVTTDAWSDTAWLRAKPVDARATGAWWEVFGDPQLSQLEARLNRDNPDLAVAWARHEQAQAQLQAVSSAQWPEVGLDGGVSRNRQSDHRPLRGANQPDVYNADTLGPSLSYELDLWGRVRHTVDAGQALADAAADDVATAQLALQAELARAYFELRGLDAQIDWYGQAIAVETSAVALTAQRHDGGLASGLDLARAQTQLHQAQVELSLLRNQRAQRLHLVATLLGLPAFDFELAAIQGEREQQTAAELPKVPVALPSTLLQRRPDIAAAQRQVMAANALIGAADAAFYPRFSFGAAVGFQNTQSSNWLTAPNRYWSLGPGVSWDLFDAGLLRAERRRAVARAQEAAQQYRAVVLKAYREVQDQLSAIDGLRQAWREQGLALQAADRSLDVERWRYKDGAISFEEVYQTQATDLDVHRRWLELRSQQQVLMVNLIAALGGGWQPDGQAQVATLGPTAPEDAAGPASPAGPTSRTGATQTSAMTDASAQRADLR